MQAKVITTKNGSKLRFPCHGASPRLFPEWWSELLTKFSNPPVFSIERKELDSSEIESDVFEVTILTIDKSYLNDGRDYINNNQ